MSISCVCVTGVVASTCLPCTFRVKVDKAHVLFPILLTFPLFATLFFQPTCSKDEWAARPDSYTKITDHNEIKCVGWQEIYGCIQFFLFPLVVFLYRIRSVSVAPGPFPSGDQFVLYRTVYCSVGEGHGLLFSGRRPPSIKRESSELQHLLQQVRNQKSFLWFQCSCIIIYPHHVATISTNQH